MKLKKERIETEAMREARLHNEQLLRDYEDPIISRNKFLEDENFCLKVVNAQLRKSIEELQGRSQKEEKWDEVYISPVIEKIKEMN
jgi:hypothetical protein